MLYAYVGITFVVYAFWDEITRNFKNVRFEKQNVCKTAWCTRIKPRRDINTAGIGF